MLWKPYKTNIKISPLSKQKVIGDTAKFWLYGEVLDVGSEVLDIAPGDQVGFTLWGLTEILEADGSKSYFLQNSPDFILAVIKKDAN